MRLLKLAANKSTFRTVIFRPEGLSLIVAEQQSDKSAQTSTYNGVGKTLLLELLHYCLGSSKRTAFEKHLKDWTFSLTIDVEGSQHTITRRADEPGEITLDQKEVSLPKLRDFLTMAAFEANLNAQFLSFRSIIPRFIRSNRSAYVEFRYAVEGEAKDPYGSMLRTAFLLGLDLELAKTKYELRNRKQKLKETMKQLEQEPLFSKLLAEDTVEIELTAFREQAARLEENLSNFRVAEDYHEIEREANRIKKQLDGHRREEVKLSEAIAQIDRSLQTKNDIPPQRVFNLYEEARAALPTSVQRTIEEVLSFQKELQSKRAYRLSRDRQGLERELREEQDQVRGLSAQLDEKLKYLSEHRALDEYIAVSNELSEIKQKIVKLQESKALRDQVDHELKRIDLALAEENIKTDEYLETSARPLIAEASDMFRSFTKELYGQRPSGLLVLNDDGDNQQRYRIDAHITADAAEGINEAKIFCVDMVLLSLRRGHRIQFLAHDSSLFGPVDPRQRLAVFRIADRVCRELRVQYIATLNRHDITSIEDQVPLEKAEWERLFGDSAVVLRLTDEKPEEKLLGIDVDMDYTA
jgi:uncharacterized protein YydD (DUF2326 family)